MGPTPRPFRAASLHGRCRGWRASSPARKRRRAARDSARLSAPALLNDNGRDRRHQAERGREQRLPAPLSMPAMHAISRRPFRRRRYRPTSGCSPTLQTRPRYNWPSPVLPEAPTITTLAPLAELNKRYLRGQSRQPARRIGWPRPSTSYPTNICSTRRPTNTCSPTGTTPTTCRCGPALPVCRIAGTARSFLQV
jgi:hypothetical protein